MPSPFGGGFLRDATPRALGRDGDSMMREGRYITFFPRGVRAAPPQPRELPASIGDRFQLRNPRFGE